MLLCKHSRMRENDAMECEWLSVITSIELSIPQKLSVESFMFFVDKRSLRNFHSFASHWLSKKVCKCSTRRLWLNNWKWTMQVLSHVCCFTDSYLVMHSKSCKTLTKSSNNNTNQHVDNIVLRSWLSHHTYNWWSVVWLLRFFSLEKLVASVETWTNSLHCWTIND